MSAHSGSNPPIRSNFSKSKIHKSKNNIIEREIERSLFLILKKMNNEKIKNRQKANLQLLEILREQILKYPDQRFGQILINTEIVEMQYDYLNEHPIVKDPFYEESVDTLERITK